MSTAKVERGSLFSKLPKGHVDVDELLGCLYQWLDEQGIDPYPAQEAAFLEIFADNHLVLQTPTGSGKSLIGVCCHLFHLGKGARSFYTSPIKALVNEKYRDLCSIFGENNVGLMTGDEARNSDAFIVCCTAEILASIAATEGDPAGIRGVVMDEFHYYADRQRGMAWQLPLLLLKRTQFVLMSATLGDTRKLRDLMERQTSRKVALVESSTRPVPLKYRYYEETLQAVIVELIAEKRAPIYVVSFTHRDTVTVAAGLLSITVTDKDTKQTLKSLLSGYSFRTPFGRDLKRFLLNGIGVHYAGMLPKYRALVETLAQKGLLGVICGTDTLGVGINIPLRTVLFTKLCKYDGAKTRVLSAREFHQISGRAGRRGFDSEGLVCALAPAHVIENLKLRRKAEARGKKSSKLRLQKAPERGFAHWDEVKFQSLTTAKSETLTPKFEINHGLIVELFKWDRVHRSRRGGYGRLIDVIESSDTTRRQKLGQKKRAKRQLHELIRAEIITRSHSPSSITLRNDLQADFSIFSDLSLFLVETAPLIAQETTALDLVSLVESIQEDPSVILLAQRAALRSEAIAQMKMDGVDYEERVEAVEKIGWHQPANGSQIELHFSRYIESKPYLASMVLSTKCITRLLLERDMSLNEFVREFGLKNSEGLVLRYLSQTLKYARQNIPLELSEDGLEEYVSQLESIVRSVDATLIDDPSAEPAQQVEASKQMLPKEARRHLRAVVQMALRAWQSRRLDRWHDIFVPEVRDAEANNSAYMEMVSRYEAELDGFTVTPEMLDNDALQLDVVKDGFSNFTQRLAITDSDDWFLHGRMEWPSSSTQQVRVSVLDIAPL